MKPVFALFCGKTLKPFPLRVAKGEGARRVEGVDVAAFDEEPFSGEAGELIGQAEASIHAEGVAGVFVDGLIGLVTDSSRRTDRSIRRWPES